MVDFQAGLDKAITALVQGAIGIAEQALREQLNGPPPKAKAQPKPKRKAVSRYVVAQPKPKAERKPKPTTVTKAVPSGGFVDVKVGDLWKRRDGDSARHVLAVDEVFVKVDSPKFKNGTLVKLKDFIKRYKRVG